MDYKKKYLKYKAKYLELKKQQGGIIFANQNTSEANRNYTSAFYESEPSKKITFANEAIRYAKLGLTTDRNKEEPAKIIEKATNLIIIETYYKWKNQTIIYAQLNDKDGLIKRVNYLINMIKTRQVPLHEDTKKSELQFLYRILNK